jgi:signal transduction histidine kinase
VDVEERMASGSLEEATVAMSTTDIAGRLPMGPRVLVAIGLLNGSLLTYLAVFVASGWSSVVDVLSAELCLFAILALAGTSAFAIHRQTRTLERLDAENRRLHATAVKKDEFLASVSHELRTPVNVVLGYIDLLLDHSFGPLEPAQRDILHRITKNASNLSHLINDLIDLSRIEAGRLKIELETVDLASLFGDMRSLMDVLLAGHAVVFRAELAPGCGRVRADAERLKQIVSNLLVNAVKFTEQGSITLRAEVSGTAVALSVTDTGIGIPPTAHRAIFEPFRQVHDRGRHVPGAGIGLSISTRLAQLMGGSLGVESEPGRGSRFTLTIPLEASAARGAGTRNEPLRQVS